eukprot:944939-Amphidinium_carterae.2
MIETNAALEPLSWEESKQIWELKPDRVLPSRWHLKWKDKETADGMAQVPKARWILQGHKDPDLDSLLDQTYAPTAGMAVINTALLAIASLKYHTFCADLSQAFLQSELCNREVYVSQPPQGVPNVEQQVLLRMRKEVYGTVLGPSSWRSTLTQELVKHNYLQSVTDPCIYLLKETSSADYGSDSVVDAAGILDNAVGELLPQKGVTLTETRFQKVKGIVILLVDDMIEAGDETHRQLMSQLQERFRFGKHVSLRQRGGAMFNGRRIEQHPDYGFSCTMADYIRDKLSTMQTIKGQTALNQGQRSTLKTVSMKVLWLARQSRPDALGTAVYLAAVKPEEYSLDHWKEASRVVQHLRAIADMCLQLPSLDPQKAKLAVVADGSPNTKADLRGLGGSM